MAFGRCYSWYRTIRQWYWRRFDLPKMTEAFLDGVRLDLTHLSNHLREMVLKGRYEQPERQLTAQFLGPSDAVLEIGAAIGLVGLFCQKRLGITRYASIEANPRTFEILLTNYQWNGVKPLAWNLALAEHDGQVELQVGADLWGDSIVHRDNRKSGASLTVSAMTLGKFVQWLPWPVNALVIDIEGAEKCLSVAEIPDSVRKIIIELHPQIIGVESVDRILSNLALRGFLVRQVVEKVYAFVR